MKTNSAKSRSVLKGNTILVISPQSWGHMLISKHHFALELAGRGNQVYFLNPPNNNNWSLASYRKRILVNQPDLKNSLFLIDQIFYFPYLLKFHSRPLYNFLISRQIRAILRIIGKPIDIIWSFDIGNLFPLNLFPNNIFKIFHPVDEPGDKHAISGANGADIIFSVTKEILDKYSGLSTPRHFINHGLANEFIVEQPPVTNDRIQVGNSGNLLRPDLDREILLKIVKENPSVDFHFFGSYQFEQSNLSGAASDQTVNFISHLKSADNVTLHGVVRTASLASMLNNMDMLLICYDIEKDQSKGTNYHKVMEYLSTGKVIVSNNISTYSDREDLVRMPAKRINNEELPFLFRDTLMKIDKYNSIELRNKRREYARQNLYANQVDLIASKIETSPGWVKKMSGDYSFNDKSSKVENK